MSLSRGRSSLSLVLELKFKFVLTGGHISSRFQLLFT